MRRPIFLIFSNVMILVVVFAFMVQSLFIMQRIAGVNHLSGRVEYQRRGKGVWRRVSANTLLQTDDVVRTGANATAELYWLDGTRMRLASQTTMRIKKSTYNGMKHADTLLFRLDVGKVWVRIVRTLRRPSKFEVETPTAVATVRGTIFSVEVEPKGGTRVSVYDGTVQVIGSEAAVSVPPKRSVHLTDMRQTPVVTALASEEEKEWKQQIGIVTPAITIAHPKDNLRTGEETVLVSGSIEPGATLWLNDQPMRVSPVGGRFAQVVHLTRGENPLVFLVKDRWGVQTEVVRTVIRTGKPQNTRPS